MTTPKTPPFLRVVEQKAQSKSVEPDDFRVPPWQRTLFAGSLPNLILFIHFESVSEADFLAAILNGRPRYVIDLRVAPRFDLGTLNRRLVFSIFQQVGAQYYDVAGKLGIKSARDAKLNPSLLVEELRVSIFGGKQSIDGPIAFLVENQQADATYEAGMIQNLEAVRREGWELLRIPHVILQNKSDRSRDLIFISHAAPEDNDFARWLGARLSGLGYKVWSDVTQLIGGEEFWDSIEDAIRTNSAKVVVCLSRTAQTKKGVLDEIACAVNVERSRGLENFVMPVRIDDLPFSEVRANILRKNIIDFSGSWAAGLFELVTAFDRDGVPKPLDNGAGAVELMANMRRRSTAIVTPCPEKLVCNWFRIESLPTEVAFVGFDGPIREEGELRKLIAKPTIGHLRLIGSFATADELQQLVPEHVRISHRCSVPTPTFLAGQVPELPGLKAKEARNHVSSLLRQGWDQAAKKRGLVAYETASRHIAWFPPNGLIENNAVQFIGPEGLKRRKSLVGWSPKRRVFWHFAIEAAPVISELPRLIFRPHVVFSEDGATLIESASRMHALRRGFCKSWWNDRWRDLIAAYAYWFSQGQPEIILEMSDISQVRISARMFELTSPVSLAHSESTTNAKESDLAEPDWADDPELDDLELQTENDLSVEIAVRELDE